MKNGRSLILWTLTIGYVLFGLLPYKWPKSDVESNNELLIYRTESTCSGDFYIKEGVLEKETVIDIHHQDPLTIIQRFDYIKLDREHPLNNQNWDITNNWKGFVIAVESISVDSSGVKSGCGIMAKVSTSSWHPEKYCPNIVTYGIKWIIGYTIVGFVLLALIFRQFIIRKK